MPRIIAPVEPRGPAPVIDLPRPRQIEAADQGARALGDFGQQLSATGNQFLELAVQQERKAERLRISTEAETRYADLRRRVDEAGTSTDARAIWQTEGPRLKQELIRFAEQRGMPEMAGELDFHAAQINNEVVANLGKRSFREAADAGLAFAESKEEAIVNAPTEAEAQRHRLELHRELEQLALNNPLFSAGDADRLFNERTERAATRRVGAMIAGAANDPGALSQIRDSLAAGAFPDLPGDRRASLQASIVEQIDRAERKFERDRIAAGSARVASLHVAAIDATTPLALDQLRGEVDELRESGFFEGRESDLVSLVSRLDSRKAAMLTGNTKAGEALTAYQTGTLESQSQADRAFDAVATQSGLEFGTPEHLQLAFNYASDAGYLPSRYNSILKNAEHSSEPADLASGAALEQRLRQVAPNTRRDAGPRVLDTIALAEQASITVEQAATRIHENIPDRATREERNAEFAEAFPDLDIREWLRDQNLAVVPGLISDTAATVDAADARHAEQALQLAYRETGDPDRAAEVATRWLQRQGYGVSSLGGGEPRFMRFAPEFMLPPGLPPAAEDAFTPDLFGTVVDAELRQLLADGGVEIAAPDMPTQAEARAGAVPEQTSVPDYALRPIEGTTERQIAAGERPEYEVLVRTEDGILSPAIVTLDDGSTEFMRYRLPTFAEVRASEKWQELVRGEAEVRSKGPANLPASPFSPRPGGA